MVGVIGGVCMGQVGRSAPLPLTGKDSSDEVLEVVMALIDETGEDINLACGSANKPNLGILYIKSNASYFSCLALDVKGVTYYYWPNTSGVLRYGTTKPTLETQDSAGATV